MLRILNKISGIVVGVLLYPLKSVLVNFFIAALSILLGLLIVFGFPPLVASVAYRKSGEKLTPALLVGFLAATVLIIAVPFVLLIKLTHQIFRGVRDIFSSIRLGAIEGYNEGLFFHVLKQAFTSVVIFSRSLQGIIVSLNGLPENQNGISDEALVELEGNDYSNTADRRNNSSETPNLQEQQTGSAFLPLTPAQLKLAEGITDLQVILEQYKSLYERLDNLDKAIVKRGSNDGQATEDFDDELIYGLEIKNPALLVKQYQDINGLWKIVPASSKIIDQNNLSDWLRRHNSHPTTREAMDRAEPYNNRPTRYRIHTYQSMGDAQELKDAATAIRKKLDLLNTAGLPPVSQVMSEIKTQISHTFFGNSGTNSTVVKIDVLENNVTPSL